MARDGGQRARGWGGGREGLMRDRRGGKWISGAGRAYIDGSWRRDSRMTSRCVFGCAGSGDLGWTPLAQRSSRGGGSCGRGNSRVRGKSLCTAAGAEEMDMSSPQRLHNVCVLLWRLPKDEVPLAGWRSVAARLGRWWAGGTHSSWARTSAAASQS